MIKEHFQRNKKSYICVGVGAAVGGAIVFVALRQAKVITIVDAFKLQIKSPTTNNVTTLVELPARGHRGNVVYCNELKRFFSSQSEAAKELGIASSNISAHLNGRNPHVNGFTFKNLGENLTEQVSLSV